MYLTFLYEVGYKLLNKHNFTKKLKSNLSNSLENYKTTIKTLNNKIKIAKNIHDSLDDKFNNLLSANENLSQQMSSLKDTNTLQTKELVKIALEIIDKFNVPSLSEKFTQRLNATEKSTENVLNELQNLDPDSTINIAGDTPNLDNI